MFHLVLETTTFSGAFSATVWLEMWSDVGSGSLEESCLFCILLSPLASHTHFAQQERGNTRDPKDRENWMPMLTN